MILQFVYTNSRPKQSDKLQRYLELRKMTSISEMKKIKFIYINH